jgi:hypothetical protein
MGFLPGLGDLEKRAEELFALLREIRDLLKEIRDEQASQAER